MDWKVGDIAIVNVEYDPSTKEYLFYLTSVSDDTATGYLTTGGYSPEKKDYSCPLSQVSRIARAIKFCDITYTNQP